MNSIINIDSLTEQQAWICQQLWLCESLQDVVDFKYAMPEDMQLDINLMIQLIFLADIDNSVIDESDCLEAQIEIMNFMRSD